MAEAPRENRVRPMTPEEIRLAEVETQNRIEAEVAERQATEGPEGGRYKVGDQMVNAEGKPVKAGQD